MTIYVLSFVIPLLAVVTSVASRRVASCDRAVIPMSGASIMLGAALDGGVIGVCRVAAAISIGACLGVITRDGGDPAGAARVRRPGGPAGVGGRVGDGR